MRKLIHSKFELDLNNFPISETEENNIFSDTFFTKYSFPFEIDLEKDLDVAFGFISSYNTYPETYFEVKYVHEDIIEDAIFEIESLQQKLICTLKFGFDQLPSFDKNLSDLSLDVFDLPTGVTIYDHAKNIVNQTYPAVNYNFPMVHTDKYDVSEQIWEHFGQIINNTNANGDFFINTYDYTTYTNYNRNIIKPLPYALHILNKGMQDDGLILDGDILNDLNLKKACLFSTNDYFLKRETFYFDLIMDYTQPYLIDFYTYYYRKTITIEKQGHFRITGSMRIVLIPGYSRFIMYVNGAIVIDQNLEPFPFGDETSIDFNYDIGVNLLNPINTIEVYSAQGDWINSDQEILCDFSINLIANYENGVVTSNISNLPKIDLKKSVPDMTFGNFVSMIKNYFNYDLTVIGNKAIMNKVENKIDYNDAIDLQFTEIKTPNRKYQSGISYLLKFTDPDYPVKPENPATPFYQVTPYLPVFQNRNGFVNSGYKTDDRTNTIEIIALPLPLITRNTVESAFAFEDDETKPYFVVYDGLNDSKNKSKSIIDFLLPSVHLFYWKKWFDFRIKSIGFVWVFRAFQESIASLKAKSKIYAYGNYHLIKSLNKTQLKPDLFEIELQTESIK